MKRILTKTLLTLAALCGMSAALAHEASFMSARLSSAQEGESPGLYLSAVVDFDFPRNLEEALLHGTPLYFVYEFHLERVRWYWVDKDLGSAKMVMRLSYSPLTRRFRLSQGGLAMSFDSLKEALDTLKVVSSWHVSDEAYLSNPDDYSAQARFSLDTQRFPLPLQVNIGTEDWELQTDWTDIELGADVRKKE